MNINLKKHPQLENPCKDQLFISQNGSRSVSIRLNQRVNSWSRIVASCCHPKMSLQNFYFISRTPMMLLSCFNPLAGAGKEQELERWSRRKQSTISSSLLHKHTNATSGSKSQWKWFTLTLILWFFYFLVNWVFCCIWNRRNIKLNQQQWDNFVKIWPLKFLQNVGLENCRISVVCVWLDLSLSRQTDLWSHFYLLPQDRSRGAQLNQQSSGYNGLALRRFTVTTQLP